MTSQLDRYLEGEQRVFASHNLNARVRSFALAQPKIELRTVEVGAGEPILFLHGFSLCAAHWAPLMDRLKEFRCVAVDQPGHGGTSAFDFRGVNLRSWYLQLLTATLDHLGMDSVHVVGHSQGAMQALWLALDSPQRVRSVIAIGTPAVAFGAALPDDMRLLARPVIGPLMFGMPKPARQYRRILESTIGTGAVAKASDDLIRTTYLACRVPGFGTTVSRYLREMFKGADAGAPQYVLDDKELARINQAVLVLMGDGDSYQQAGEVADRVSRIPRGHLATVAGGHEPWLDNIDVCAGAIAAALSY